MTDHPTDAERFFFDNNGYLILEDFLAPDRVAALYAALERTIERRRDPQFRREHEPAFADRLDEPNVRVMHLLAEDPLFLEMLDYEPMMAYVHGLFNEMPHLHSTDAFYEVEPADYHGQGWHIDGIQDGFRNLKPHIPLLQFKVGYYLSDMSEPDQGNLTLVPGKPQGAARARRREWYAWGRANMWRPGDGGALPQRDVAYGRSLYAQRGQAGDAVLWVRTSVDAGVCRAVALRPSLFAGAFAGAAALFSTDLSSTRLSTAGDELELARSAGASPVGLGPVFDLAGDALWGQHRGFCLPAAD